MIYTLKHEANNCVYRKFYEQEGVANQRKGKNWILGKVNTDMPDFISYGKNNGAAKSPRYKVVMDGIEYPVLTLGLANSLMIELTQMGKEVKVYSLEKTVSVPDDFPDWQ